MKANFLTFLLFLFALSSFADNLENLSSIKGEIKSSDGQPVGFVTVSLLNTRVSIAANEDGQFEILNIDPGHYQLQVSGTGMQSKTIEVVAEKGKQAQLQITMSQKASELESVVINARHSLNQKTVTIGKSGISPLDMPQAITVIDASVLREQQAQRLSDAIKNVNGVTMADQRASTSESFYARGYNLGSGNYFKNGGRINSGSMPEMSSLEKVEVLKGSAAILYGNVAPGGIVNLVTKKPKFKFGAELSLRGGSYGLFKPTFDVYGPITKNIAYRVNGTYETAASYRDNVHSERFYVNPSFLFKLNKRTELVLEADYLSHDFTPDFGIGSLDNTIITPVPRNTFYGTPWQYAKTRQATASASVKHNFNSQWTLNAAASYQRYSRDYYSTERIQAKANGDWVRPLGRSNNTQDYIVGTVDLTGTFKTGKIEHKLLVGVDADHYEDGRYYYDQPSTYDTINLLDPNKYTRRTDIPGASITQYNQTPTTRFGAYVQDLISLSAKLKLLLGVRYSTQSVGAADTTFYPDMTKSRGVLESKTDDAFSPRFGLVYKPFTNTAFFASYANSFVINNGTDIYGDRLAPSTIDQFEIGVKNDLLQGKLSVNVTAYRIINNNLAQTAPFLADGTPNNNTAFKQLTGQTTSDGVELDLMAQPVKGLNLMGGYSYNYMRYTKTPDARGNYVEGERLVNMPAHTANISAFYTVQSGILNRLKFGASAFYTGDRYGGWNNTKEQSQTYSRLIEIDGFATVDLNIGYSFKKFSFMGKVSNITNTYSYFVHENYSVNPIPPRQVIGTVSYRF